MPGDGRIGGIVRPVLRRAPDVLERSGEPSAAPQLTSAPATTSLRAELDLRKFAVLRSEQSADGQEPVVVPTGVRELTLLRPVGSEPAPYEIQVLDADLESLATAHSVAESQDFITTVRQRSICGRPLQVRINLPSGAKETVGTRSSTHRESNARLRSHVAPMDVSPA